MSAAVSLVVPPRDIAPLRRFVTGFAAILDSGAGQAAILEQGGDLLARLVSRDDWLPDAFARPHPDRYQQYLLHCDSAERFSVVAFVWGPGQTTPIHDHRVWGLVGVLRGAEKVQNFRRRVDGSLVQQGATADLFEGEVEGIDPDVGDIHRVANAFADRTSISIHVYGANIGAVERATYRANGEERPFISGYANDVLPNLWNGVIQV
ncbi:putative metal-dependent enzyme (double-stranded beta helix superfamily) [Novosphingobium sp. PhB165]|uniref:cysteine dioxygenase family protein n=1 Tax=Novosphingobium sp. PhB165 TaxID=2485105 RepID=UPI001051AD51|nr:cysteine dioxygenase [Novosphingobium sp. PhB165]TCM14189.1 putative metal-dependent enzyme (double-stranded beta helix superfamily) [Novosphingobium sp. PhB165]